MIWRKHVTRLATGSLLLLLCGGTILTVLSNRRLGEGSGLSASYWGSESTPGRAEIAVVERFPIGEGLRQQARSTGASGLIAEWRGYVIVPKSGEYRFTAAANGDVSLRINRTLVIDNTMRSGAPPVNLRRGLHAVDLRYSTPDRIQLDLLWAQNAGAFHRIPGLLLVPDLRPANELRWRIRLTSWQLLWPIVWCAAIAGIAYRFATRFRGVVGLQPWTGPSRRAMTPLMIAGVLLFTTGIWWGVPEYGSWAPDELSPAEVLDAAEAYFRGGWATIYPPLHYSLLSTLYVPFRVSAAAGLIELDALNVTAAMLLVGRTLSVLMALGTVLIVCQLASELNSPRAGLLAVAIFGVALPLTYYAKTVNLDVPYTFWLAAAVLHYSRAFRLGRPRDFYLFTVTGIAAIATKDQAYGFFVLPAAYMIIGSLVPAGWRAGVRGIPSRRVLLMMLVLGGAALIVFFNLAFNANGFVEHVRLISGPASQDYRMYPGTLAGQGSLAWTTFVEFGRAVSWPLFVLLLAGGLVAVWRRDVRLAHLILPALSYYLCFISVIGYVYDRFLLGLVVILAVIGGVCLDRWLLNDSARRLTQAVTWAVVLYALGRGVSLNYLVIEDSRYQAEHWLRQHLEVGVQAAAVGPREYLPRAAMVPWMPLRASLEDLAQAKPDVIIVNVAFSHRAPSGSDAARFYSALASGAAGYRAIATFHTPTRGLPLGLERRFRDPVEDPFSNLSKVNPPIQIYWRSPTTYSGIAQLGTSATR